MCETTPPVPKVHLETLLRDKTIACDELFRKCLGGSTACEHYIDFQQLQLQCQQAYFNKWAREFEADETGPSSLDYRLQRKPALRDVVAALLGCLIDTLLRRLDISVDGGETDAESLTMKILQEEYYIDENLKILRGIMVPVFET
ncbi:hypothetical protein J3458_008733 [Metarhizium acridum]|uniref:Uncharacterized protein n=1 Tax=Metarhizium acridum (strain CQMa 102) TaxID=655827 RepID=E9EHJ2_METAQ|nr:uncharacterized protein MAC_09340 [Metarhizium acridum CQMa 102]EFY84635.1 hypothetical protein MAC_09340 [Metarhizium acridum CQMa 102]KAG8414825.1 hypothetical protein J3458_008733 [Metarhizium acridum]